MSADAAFPGGKTACAGDIGPLYRERAHPARPRRHPAFGRNYYAGHMSAFPAATEDARHGTTGLAERYRAVRARSIALAAPLSAADAMVQSMHDASPARSIGRATCRERVCGYVERLGVAGCLKY